ncbi:MAG: DUF6544 family protein [Cellulosilyticaceae bacterium]
MWKIIVGSSVILILAAVIWFVQPYSPLKADFEKLDQEILAKESKVSGTFELENMAHLPLPMQKFFVYSGLIGKPMMQSSRTVHTDVDFGFTEGEPTKKIQYIQNNYAHVPARLAFIDTKMYGIPFQGLDSYKDGIGGMKGVLAKGITLFDQKGKEMDQASLVTVLAESIVCPSAFLMDCMTWETIDDTHVKVTIEDQGVTASGVYTLSEEGAILSFTTNDRYQTGPDGSAVSVPWTATCGNYVERDGIKYPTSFQAIWNRKEGDWVYFDCKQVDVTYRY